MPPCLQVMDVYYESMASEGTRTGAKAGDTFLLVPAGAEEAAATDNGGATVIELPNEDGLVIFRVRRSDPGATDFLREQPLQGLVGCWGRVCGAEERCYACAGRAGLPAVPQPCTPAPATPPQWASTLLPPMVASRGSRAPGT